MKNLVTLIDRCLVLLLTVLMAALVLAIVWQVLSRYLLHAPAAFTEELARFILIWVSLLGASYAFRARMHLGLNLIVEKLHANNKRRVELFALAAVAMFAFAVLVIGGGRLVLLTAQLQQVSAVLGLSMAWVYAVIPLSGALMLVYVLDFALALLSGAEPTPGIDQNQNDALDDSGASGPHTSRE